MATEHPLARRLREAAAGRWPPADGGVEVVASPDGKADAVVAFTGHVIVAADVAEHAVRCRLERAGRDDPFAAVAASTGAGFLSWLAGWLGCQAGSFDAVLVASGPPPGPAARLVPARGQEAHARLGRARRYRDAVSAWTGEDGEGMVILGRGLAGRWEVSVEVDAAARGRGVGRRLVGGARTLVPEPAGVFAQVAPGNAASLRAFLAAGFRPVGAEVLFLRPGS